MFTRDALLASDWYAARLDVQQTLDVRLWTRHVGTLEAALADPTRLSPALASTLSARLEAASLRLDQVQSPDHRASLQGFLGADPAALG